MIDVKDEKRDIYDYFDLTVGYGIYRRLSQKTLIKRRKLHQQNTTNMLNKIPQIASTLLTLI